MNHAPTLADQTDDIQAVLASGFGWLTSSRFWLLTILDVDLVGDWLLQLERSGLLHSVSDVGAKKDRGDEPGEIAAIAFSCAGLRKLGVLETSDFPFPTAFKSGMGSALREQLLRDRPRSCWSWSDQEADPEAGNEPLTAHILLGAWWADAAGPSLPAFPVGAFRWVEVHGCPGFFHGKNLYEPFGFRDGISQPTIYGLKEEVDPDAPGLSPAQRTAVRDHRVAGGEFILGYRNEYDELSYCPDVQGWATTAAAPHPRARFALNGTYLAVRQIEQHVDAFKQLEESAAPRCPLAPSLGEKLMGRLRDGRSLEKAGQPLPAPPSGATRALAELAANSFRYRVADENGFVTPLGSHVRRANPRDMLGHDSDSGITSSKLHRLLRRGRPYRGRDPDGEPTQGLFFIACNTDLERQFEFVHQRWMMNPRFADLEQEDDPIVGGARRYSVPGLPCGTSQTLQAFTTTLGGGYFFLPGLSALHFICAPFAPTLRCSHSRGAASVAAGPLV